MKFSDHTLNDISGRLRIEEIVGQYVSLNYKSGRYWGCCPFHTEKTPSFTVTPDKNMYYCFGCHKGGSVFSFVMEVEKLTFVEAVRYLAEKAGVELENGDSGNVKDNSVALKELYKRVAGSFHYILTEKPEGKPALKYLEKRGVTAETIEQFQLGYAPRDSRWLASFLRGKNFSDEFLRESGLFTKKNEKISLFFDRIIFPIISARGDILAFGGRLLDGDGPKYLNSPETVIFSKRHNVFGIHLAVPEIKKSGLYHIVEGYLDVIAMHQAGISNTVAPLGTAFTPEQARFLKRYAEKAVLVFDGDEAGFSAAVKAIFVCEDAGLDSAVVVLSNGMDPADVFLKNGADALKNSVKFPINSFEYYLNTVIRRNNPGSLGGRNKVLLELFRLLDHVSSAVRRETLSKMAGKALGVEKNAVDSDYDRYLKKTFSIAEIPRPQEKPSGELFLLVAAVANFQYFPVVRREMTAESLKDPKAKELFIVLEECYRRGDFSMEVFLSRLEDEALKTYVLERLATEEFGINPERTIRDVARRIQVRALEERRDRILQLIQQSETDRNLDTRELLQDKMALDEELKKLKVTDDE